MNETSKKWFVKVIRPDGRFETINTFDSAKRADEWLCKFITRNHCPPTDFTISSRP